MSNKPCVDHSALQPLATCLLLKVCQPTKSLGTHTFSPKPHQPTSHTKPIQPTGTGSQSQADPGSATCQLSKRLGDIKSQMPHSCSLKDPQGTDIKRECVFACGLQLAHKPQSLVMWPKPGSGIHTHHSFCIPGERKAGSGNEHNYLERQCYKMTHRACGKALEESLMPPPIHRGGTWN